MRGLLEELKRRNVHRAAAAYVAGGWLLLQVVEVLVELYGLDVGSVRWILPLLAAAFVPAMVIAWLFEWTPRGLERESDLAAAERADEGERRAQGRRSDRIIIALLVCALAVLGFDKLLTNAGRDEGLAPAGSIAVLPFLDLSPGGGQEYFALGISEELLNLLAQIRGLRVAARTSSFVYRGADRPIGEIAAALNVRFVLEGSVRLLEDRVRVTAQLIDAESGFHLWSQNFDRTLAGLFEVQEEVATRVVGAVQPALRHDVSTLPRTDPDTYRMVLEAEYLAGQTSAATLREALGLFRSAVDRDPDYARAWLGLSVTLANLAGDGRMDRDLAYREAQRAAERARVIDPQHFGAYDQLAWLARVRDGDLQAAAHYLERALELAPWHPDVAGNAAVFLQSIGRLEAALPLHEFSVERDPLDPNGLFNMALANYFADRLDVAQAAFLRLRQLAPDYIGVRYRLGTIAWRRGDAAAALRHFDAERDEGFRLKGRAIALMALGREGEARAALDALIAHSADRFPSEITQVYAQWGDLDQAFEWLERDYQVEGPAGWGEYQLMHLYEPLFGDPRWGAFLDKVGASPSQLAAIEFDLSAVSHVAL